MHLIIVICGEIWILAWVISRGVSSNCLTRIKMNKQFNWMDSNSDRFQLHFVATAHESAEVQPALKIWTWHSSEAFKKKS